ncbi:MAG: type II toxin-antitoxin system death-on-curing family toxin [Candidatus Obscuribacterales bacterium]|nr:type II toxin-antitoxin system death-on-curing family toxin [Candidatus Obscuribacterales bacterium]
MDKIVFLSQAQVKAIHQNQIELYGGLAGVRDEGLLSSALAQPYATFGGTLLNDSVYLMAAAYLFGLCKNHCFVDGNKRTAAVAALVFLEMNGVALDLDEEGLYELVQGVVEGHHNKEAIALLIETHASELVQEET